MSCMKNYYELGNMLDQKTTPKPLIEYTQEEWYQFAYNYVRGEKLPLNWEKDKNLLETYYPANIIDYTADCGMLEGMESTA